MTTIERVVSVKEVEKYLPHRPPMVWVDEVLRFSEKSGVCRVTLKADGLYMGSEGLRATSCLEFIAQAYGFISVCHHIFIMDPNSKPLTRAFLASINDTNLPDPAALAQLRPGDEIHIEIDGVRQMGPIVIFHGRMLHGDAIICESQMKVFKEYSK